MQIVNGDITEIMKSGYILHQVNCYGVMGAGLAKTIKEKWPIVNQEYVEYCKTRLPKDLLGQVQYVTVTDDLKVINCFSQLEHGNGEHFTREDILIKNIEQCADDALKEGNIVAIPWKIGCGLGGGDWEYIYKRISYIDNLLICKL